MYSWDFPTKALYYWLHINLGKGEKKVNLLRGPLALSLSPPPPPPSISLSRFLLRFFMLMKFAPIRSRWLNTKQPYGERVYT